MALKSKPQLNTKTLSQNSSLKITYIQRFCKLAYIYYDFHAMDLVSIINRQMLRTLKSWMLLIFSLLKMSLRKHNVRGVHLPLFFFNWCHSHVSQSQSPIIVFPQRHLQQGKDQKHP